MDERPPPGFRLPPLDQEEIPTLPPEPSLRFMGANSPEAEEQFQLSRESTRWYGTIAYELLDASWRLVELSRTRQGGYEQGLELPSSAKAAATGAIAIACTAFEALLNDAIQNARTGTLSPAHLAHNRLLAALRKLTPRERLDAFAALAGRNIDWGSEPYQSLDKLLSLRKTLFHHEGYQYATGDDYWPAKSLRELPDRFKSPYPLGPTQYRTPLEWHVHVLTPKGAAWAVRTVYDIDDELDTLWRAVLYNFEVLHEGPRWGTPLPESQEARPPAGERE
jgi:hypothetical protein